MLTTAQVARILKLTPRRVRALKDRIGCEKIGDRLVFRPEAVKQFQQERAAAK